MAFNAKNLTYDKSEPAFLQRLKAGYAAQGGRNNVQHARSGKSRLKMGDGEDDDEPVILDESGEVVEKKVYEGMLKGESHKEGQTKDDEVDSMYGKKNESEKDQAADREKQKIIEIGAAKKRKAVKIVSGDDNDNIKEDMKNPSAVLRESHAVENKDSKRLGPSKPKKKAKKIKLSFDDPEP